MTSKSPSFVIHDFSQFTPLPLALPQSTKQKNFLRKPLHCQREVIVGGLQQTHIQGRIVFAPPPPANSSSHRYSGTRLVSDTFAQSHMPIYLDPPPPPQSTLSQIAPSNISQDDFFSDFIPFDAVTAQPSSGCVQPKKGINLRSSKVTTTFNNFMAFDDFVPIQPKRQKSNIGQIVELFTGGILQSLQTEFTSSADNSVLLLESVLGQFLPDFLTDYRIVPKPVEKEWFSFDEVFD